MYWIMNRERDAISFGGSDSPSVYEGMKKAILNKNDRRYGSVLVKLKRKQIGYEIKLKLKWADWMLKPHFPTKYNHCFHWWFFMIWVDGEYIDVQDCVVKDHLGGC